MAGEICEKMNLNPREMISDLCYLVDHKLLKEVGIIRRKVIITEKGAAVIESFDSSFKN